MDYRGSHPSALLAIGAGWNSLLFLELANRLSAHPFASSAVDGFVCVGVFFAGLTLWAIRPRQAGVVAAGIGALLFFNHVGPRVTDHYEGLVDRWYCVKDGAPDACLEAANYHRSQNNRLHRSEASRFEDLARQNGADSESYATTKSEDACERINKACRLGDRTACREIPTVCEIQGISPSFVGCRDGRVDACYDAGLALEDAEPERALSYFAAACGLAHSVDQLDGCFKLVDSGRADHRSASCERVLDTCLFQPGWTCKAYRQRCETFAESPY